MRINWIERILFLKNILQKGDRVFQIGFSLDRLYSDIFPISWLIGACGRLLIVDPDHRAFIKLWRRRWTMLKGPLFEYRIMAAAERPMNVYLQRAKRMKHNATTKIPTAGAILTNATTIDMLAMNTFTPNVIILTCNGAERDALLGAKQTMGHKPTLIIAPNSYCYDLLGGYVAKTCRVGKQTLIVAEGK